MMAYIGRIGDQNLRAHALYTLLLKLLRQLACMSRHIHHVDSL